MLPYCKCHISASVSGSLEAYLSDAKSSDREDAAGAVEGDVILDCEVRGLAEADSTAHSVVERRALHVGAAHVAAVVKEDRVAVRLRGISASLASILKLNVLRSVRRDERTVATRAKRTSI